MDIYNNSELMRRMQKDVPVLTGTTKREEHANYNHVCIAENLEEIYSYILSTEEVK